MFYMHIKTLYTLTPMTIILGRLDDYILLFSLLSDYSISVCFNFIFQCVPFRFFLHHNYLLSDGFLDIQSKVIVANWGANKQNFTYAFLDKERKVLFAFRP